MLQRMTQVRAGNHGKESGFFCLNHSTIQNSKSREEFLMDWTWVMWPGGTYMGNLINSQIDFI